MIDFLTQYGKYIALGVIVLLEIVILILKKRPIKLVDAITTYICSVLPTAINQAEGEYVSGHGKEKLEMVIDLVNQYLISSLGLTSYEADKYRSYIIKRVEEILETPQKKGEE